MEMTQLNTRQKKILEYIAKNKESQNKDILHYFKESVSRSTIARDLAFLYKNNFIQKKGKARNVSYFENLPNALLSYINPETYFQEDIDKRKLLKKNFNFDIFEVLTPLFFKEELKELDKLNNDYRERIEKLTLAVFKKEQERMIIEFAWKSSRLEGNTYNLIDTEFLIKESIRAEGHKEEETIMLLNHKKAFDYILKEKKEFKELSVESIENIHALLVSDLKVKKGIRKGMVGILGTNYRPIDNQYQIKEALEKLIKLVNSTKHPIEKALIAYALIPYIQPFEDGNKRTSRVLVNAILLAHNYSLLSLRDIEAKDYKKTLILFYEQNNLRLFKELFLRQFKFSNKNYF
ncbi:MAG: Fic family protein [Candidatus Pacebacteria bacterium]|nr:Fic family protein [Candidatus Paceibacterota bacterium]